MTASSASKLLQCSIFDAQNSQKGTAALILTEFVKTSAQASLKGTLVIPVLSTGSFVIEIKDMATSRFVKHGITVFNPSKPSIQRVFPSVISSAGTPILVSLGNMPSAILGDCKATFKTTTESFPVFPSPILRLAKSSSGESTGMFYLNFTSTISGDDNLDITDAVCGSVELFANLITPIALKAGVYPKFVVPSRIMSNGDQIISVGIVGFDTKSTSSQMFQASMTAAGSSNPSAIDIAVLSWVPQSESFGIAVLKVSSVDVVVISSFSISIVRAGDQGRRVSFDIDVVPVVPKVSRVIPSSFSNSVDTEITLTIEAFPVLSAMSFSQLQVQVFGKNFPVIIRASNSMQTLLSFTIRAADQPPIGNASVSVGLVGGISVSSFIQVVGSIQLVAIMPSVAAAASPTRMLITAEHSVSTKSASILLFCLEGCTLSNHRPPMVINSRSDISRTRSSIMATFVSGLVLGGTASLALCDNPTDSLNVLSPPWSHPSFQCVNFSLPVQRLMPRIAALTPRSGPISGGMPVELTLFALDAADLRAIIQIDSTTILPFSDVNSTIPGTSPVKYTRFVRFLLPSVSMPTSAAVSVKTAILNSDPLSFSLHLNETFNYYL